jgi:hypothetical protein
MTVDSAFSLQYLSHALEMTKKFISQHFSFFVFHLPILLLTKKFVYPTLFSSVPPPPKVMIMTGLLRKKTL